MYGQIVIGPPGSGKSTYCHGMYQFMSAIGRKLCIINLDPANDRLPYPCELDIRDYISLEEIMEELDLGPINVCIRTVGQTGHRFIYWQN